MLQRMKRSAKRLGFGFGIALSPFVLYWITYYGIASAALDRRLDALHRAGVATELASVAPATLDAQDNAQGLYQAAFALAVPWDEEDGRRFDDALAHGFASLSAADKGRLRQWLDKNAESLSFAARAGARPRCVWERDWSAGFCILLPELAHMRKLGKTLAVQALARADEGRFDQARESVHALFAAAEALRDDPILISQLVRWAITKVAFGTVERCVPAEADAAEIARWQEILPPEHWLDAGLETAVRGEVALAAEMVAFRPEQLLCLPNDLYWRKTPLSWSSLLYVAGRPLVYSDGASYLEKMQRILPLLALSYPEARPQADAIQREVESGSRFWNPVSGMLMGAWGASLEHRAATEAWGAVVRAGLASEAAKRATGAYPAAIDAADPLTGQPLLYRPEQGLLYSVGEGGVDDGGDVGERWGSGKDIVWRLRG